MATFTPSEARRQRRSPGIWILALLVVAGCASAPREPRVIPLPSYQGRKEAPRNVAIFADISELWACEKLGSFKYLQDAGRNTGNFNARLLAKAAEYGGDIVTLSKTERRIEGYYETVPVTKSGPFQTSTDWQGNTTLSKTYTETTEERWVPGSTYYDITASVWRFEPDGASEK